MALGSPFPSGALASPTSSCGLAPHRHALPALISGFLRPGGSLVRPAIAEVYPGALISFDNTNLSRSHSPRVLIVFACIHISPALSDQSLFLGTIYDDIYAMYELKWLE